MRKTILIFLWTPLILMGQNPNFSEDIAPIFYNKCTACHHTGGLAPFSLVDYSTAAAFSNSGSISYMVSNGVMPPWPPDTTYQNYAHERTLTQNEINLIIDWKNAGSPQGDPALAPNPPVYSSVGILPNPDLILKIPNHTSSAVNEDEYVCFSLPTGLLVDKMVKAIEIVPGNTAIVHHTLAFLDTLNATPSIINDCMGIDGKLLAAYAPGSQPTIFPNGTNTKMGMKINANSSIVLQMHYPAGSAGMSDSTAIHLFFYPNTINNVREVYIDRLLENWFLYIPANSTPTFNTTYPPGSQTLSHDYSLLAILPHMHLIGKNITAYSIDSNLDTLPLIKINSWDFEWQQFYYFKNILKIEQGSKLYSQAQYDNTSNNPHNPNSPPIDVYAGESTTDEMFVNYLMHLPYQIGDENLDLENLMTVSMNNLTQGLDNLVYPNPSSGNIQLKFKGETGVLKILTLLGKKVFSESIYKKEVVSVSHLPAGIYIYNITNQFGNNTGKLIIK